MKNKHKSKLFSLIIAMVLIISAVSLRPILSENDDMTEDEIFNALVLKAVYKDPENDEVEPGDYENVNKISTVYRKEINGDYKNVKEYYLTDLEYLKQLPNLYELILHIPKESLEIPYNMNILNELNIEALMIGTKAPSEVITEEHKENIRQNQVQILNDLDPVNKISVIVYKYGMLDNDYLIGVDLKPNIENISTQDNEVNMQEIISSYEFSHEVNGRRIYKSTIDKPFLKYIKLNDDAVIVEDERAEFVEWTMNYYMNFEQDPDTAPIMYDVDGEIIELEDNPYSYTGRGVVKMEVFFDEDRLEEIKENHVLDIYHNAVMIFGLEDYLVYLENELLTETDPVEIEYLEEMIRYQKEDIEIAKAEQEQTINSGVSNATTLVDFSIVQENEVLNNNYSLYTSQRFYHKIALLFDDELYKVEFESNGGTPVPTQENIPYGMKASEPGNPSKGEDIEFEGWFKESTFENIWDFDQDVVTENIILYAKWDEPDPTYKVTFNSNGGSDVDKIEDIAKGATIEQPENPTNGNKEFLGWYLDNGTFKNRWNFSKNTIKTDTILHARWSNDAPIEGELYKVEFESNGGTSVDPIVGIEPNSKIDEPKEPTKQDYAFVKWYKEPEFINEWDFNTDIVIADIVLYAGWRAGQPENKYTVTYETNGGSTIKPTYNVIYDTKIKEPIKPVKENSEFTSWFKDSGLTEEWNFNTDTVKSDITLYAGWYVEPIIVEHIVNFDCKGGTDVPAQTIIHGGFVVEPSKPTKEGYIFEGWYKDNQTFTELWNFNVDTIIKDTTLYAKWSKKTGEEPEEPIVPPIEPPVNPPEILKDPDLPSTGINENVFLYIILLLLSSLYLRLKLKSKIKY